MCFLHLHVEYSPCWNSFCSKLPVILIGYMVIPPFQGGEHVRLDEFVCLTVSRVGSRLVEGSVPKLASHADKRAARPISCGVALPQSSFGTVDSIQSIFHVRLLIRCRCSVFWPGVYALTLMGRRSLPPPYTTISYTPGMRIPADWFGSDLQPKLWVLFKYTDHEDTSICCLHIYPI